MKTTVTPRLTEDLFRRIRGEYLEMPGLRVTFAQAQRLWDLDPAVCRLALESLVAEGFLRRADGDRYVRLSDGGSGDARRLRMAKADIAAGAGTPSYRRSTPS